MRWVQSDPVHSLSLMEISLLGDRDGTKNLYVTFDTFNPNILETTYTITPGPMTTLKKKYRN